MKSFFTHPPSTAASLKRTPPKFDKVDECKTSEDDVVMKQVEGSDENYTRFECSLGSNLVASRWIQKFYKDYGEESMYIPGVTIPNAAKETTLETSEEYAHSLETSEDLGA